MHALLSWEWASWVRLWIVRARAQAHGQSSMCVYMFLFIFDFNAEPRITFHFSHASACLIYSTPTSSTKKDSLFTLFLSFSLFLSMVVQMKRRISMENARLFESQYMHMVLPCEHIIFIVLMMYVDVFVSILLLLAHTRFFFLVIYVVTCTQTFVFYVVLLLFVNFFAVIQWVLQFAKEFHINKM